MKQICFLAIKNSKRNLATTIQLAWDNMVLCLILWLSVLSVNFFIGACIDLDLGLENERISDGNITASSVQNASTPAKNGRLNYTSGSSWCAGTGDTNPYVQIDLQTLHIICAVSTQGNSQADQWVKTYKLQFSINGTTWMDYKEAGQVKVQCFLSNDNLSTKIQLVLHVFHVMKNTWTFSSQIRIFCSNIGCLL